MNDLYSMTSPPAEPCDPLLGEARTELIVIGGGITGLSTAIHASRAGTETVVLEAGEIGQGGSGRNHGHCVPILRYLNREQAIRTLGAEKGDRYTNILLRSGEAVFSMVRDYGIACEAVQSGALQVADTPQRAETLRRTAAYYAGLGVAVRFLDVVDVRAATGSDVYCGGWVHPDGGHLNPLAFTRGLARAASGLGVRVHTGSPVLKIERQGEGWLVTTPRASVAGRRLVVTSNAYSGKLLPPLGRSFIPLQAYGLASAPLDPAVRRRILPGNESLGDNRPDVRYFRFDRDNRLIVGGMVECSIGVNLSRTTKLMSRKVGEVFPELRDIRWDHFWTGREAVNRDMRPHVYNPAENLYALAGYSGRGVPAAMAFGEILGLAGSGTAAADLPVEMVGLTSQPGARAIGMFVTAMRGPFNRFRSVFFD